MWNGIGQLLVSGAFFSAQHHLNECHRFKYCQYSSNFPPVLFKLALPVVLSISFLRISSRVRTQDLMEQQRQVRVLSNGQFSGGTRLVIQENEDFDSFLARASNKLWKGQKIGRRLFFDDSAEVLEDLNDVIIYSSIYLLRFTEEVRRERGTI